MLQFDIENKGVWETLQYTNDPIIMYGTGNGADKVFEIFNELNISVAGVTASDGFVRERYFHGFRVTPISDFLEKYENIFSNSIPESDISKINSNSKKGIPTLVSDETIELLNKSLNA